jgi:hypothetical protein
MRNDGGAVATNPSYTSGFVFSSEFGNPAITTDVRVNRTTVKDLIGQVGWAFGFGSSPVSGPNTGFQGHEDDIVYSNCIAENVEVAGQGVYAAGYIVKGDKNQVVKCTANFIKDNRANPKAYGIILDTVSGPVENAIISKNRLTDCDGAGILDLSPSRTNIFNSNYAALNGPGEAGPNYVNLPPSSAALIQDWPLNGVPAPPPVGGSELANVSVHL